MPVYSNLRCALVDAGAGYRLTTGLHGHDSRPARVRSVPCIRTSCRIYSGCWFRVYRAATRTRADGFTVRFCGTYCRGWAEQTIGNQVTDVTKEPPKAVAAEPPLVKNKPAPATPKKRFDRDQLVGAIASLQPTEVTTGSSRVRRLEEHSASKQTLAAEEAYLAMWRRKCERIGRINYPPGNIQGELVMRVSILSNGYLESVRIIRSSGSSLLDNAALKP
ncbi:MAG: hypothetical protein CM15mP120_07420 [Pseudomonadota bacterium]|nr:MAG: hypothetical protein CM15mP120_07420 [Pseudomonadota bacterium]